MKFRPKRELDRTDLEFVLYWTHAYKEFGKRPENLDRFKALGVSLLNEAYDELALLMLRLGCTGNQLDNLIRGVLPEEQRELIEDLKKAIDYVYEANEPVDLDKVPVFEGDYGPVTLGAILRNGLGAFMRSASPRTCRDIEKVHKRVQTFMQELVENSLKRGELVFDTSYVNLDRLVNLILDIEPYMTLEDPEFEEVLREVLLNVRREKKHLPLAPIKQEPIKLRFNTKMPEPKGRPFPRAETLEAPKIDLSKVKLLTPEEEEEILREFEEEL